MLNFSINFRADHWSMSVLNELDSNLLLEQ